MKQLAILHSGDLAHVSPGGVDQYVKNLITGLGGYEISVFGVTPAGKYRIGIPAIREYEGHPYTFIPIIDDSSYPLTPRFMRALFRNRRALTKFDCIYAQRIEFSLPFALSPLSRHLIQIIHGSSANAKRFMNIAANRAYLFAERMSIGIAQKTVIILNRHDEGMPYYLKRYRRHSDRLLYGHIPVDLSDFHPRERSSPFQKLGVQLEAFVILYCGRIEEVPKRVLIYPDISRLLPFEHRFVIIGTGSDLDALKAKCSDLGVLRSISTLRTSRSTSQSGRVLVHQYSSPSPLGCPSCQLTPVTSGRLFITG